MFRCNLPLAAFTIIQTNHIFFLPSKNILGHLQSIRNVHICKIRDHFSSMRGVIGMLEWLLFLANVLYLGSVCTTL